MFYLHSFVPASFPCLLSPDIMYSQTSKMPQEMMVSDLTEGSFLMLLLMGRCRIWDPSRGKAATGPPGSAALTVYLQ